MPKTTYPTARQRIRIEKKIRFLYMIKSLLGTIKVFTYYAAILNRTQ